MEPVRSFYKEKSFKYMNYLVAFINLVQSILSRILLSLLKKGYFMQNK